MSIINRGIQLKDAPKYLGMNKNYFNKSVRPFLNEIPTGTRCVVFDRLDLDNWFEHHKQSCGRPSKRRPIWLKKESQDFKNVKVSGLSTKSSVDIEFAKAVEQAISTRRKSI